MMSVRIAMKKIGEVNTTNDIGWHTKQDAQEARMNEDRRETLTL